MPMADDSDATVSSSHLKDGGPSSDIEDEEDRAPPRKQVDALGNSMNEQSPLLSPRSSGDEESFLQDGRSRDALELRDLEAEQETKSIWYLFMLTLSIGGYDITFTHNIQLLSIFETFANRRKGCKSHGL